MKNGFYDSARAQEVRCAGVAANQFVGIEDVTAKVNEAIKPGMPAGEAAQAQRAATSGIEKECAAWAEVRCEVISLYSGAVYNLYRYKRYADVRLVFAPEFDAAFFGGDPDNYTYPRYDLDIAFFRVYEHDKPAQLENYLHWSPTGAKENQLVFVSGTPGSTSRWKTMAQLYFLRDVEYPLRLGTGRQWNAVLEKFASESLENARISQEYLYGARNGFKAISGYAAGMKNNNILAQKKAKEDELRFIYLAKNPNQPDPWKKIAEAMKVQREIYNPLAYLERMRGFVSPLARYARTLVRSAEEKTKPNAERLQEYRDSALPAVEQQLFSDTPIYKSLEVCVLGESFAQMQQALGPDNPDVVSALRGKKPEEAAEWIVERTGLESVEVRKQLYLGGQPAIEASTDPLIVLMRSIDPDARAARKRYENEVDSVERSEGAKIAQTQFSVRKYAEAPDATSSLRLSYGVVCGYLENGKSIPYFTTMDGAFQHAAEHGNKPPFRLPESWTSARSKLALATPLNFVSTADVLGGNSGSPIVNGEGEVVGVIFDVNIYGLASNFIYSDESGRAVSVDVRAIKEALKKIYGASALAAEL